MRFSVRIDETTAGHLRHFPPVRKQRIKKALHELAIDPFLGKPLEEELFGFYSYRVGSFRIIYEVDQTRKAIRVAGIGPRRSIYEEIEKEFRSDDSYH